METISEYFTGKTLLITGATGFFGQPLVEKILWVAPGVRRIYLLIRPKTKMRGGIVSAQERIEKELFQSTAFDRLHSRHGTGIGEFLKDRLVAVSGDLSQDDLQLDPETADNLRQEVDVVINSAAVVSFDAPLDEALEMNVLGAQRLVRFVCSCPKAILVHVSTAYVCGTTTSSVPETLHHSEQPGAEDFPNRAFSDIERDIGRIWEIVERVQRMAHSREIDRELKRSLIRRSRKRRLAGARRRELLEKLRRQWTRERLVEEGMSWARERGWNDTYTYTKALGERVVMRERGEVATAILRPSVIESSLSEPSPGWLDGLRMADPLIAAIGKGRLKTLPMNPEVVLDLVPVDMVVNATLAAIPTLDRERGTAVYQVATGSLNPITLGYLYELIYLYFRGNPMLDRSGKPIWIRPLKFQTPERFRFQHKLRSVPLESAEKTLERLPLLDINQKFKRRISATRIANEKLFYYGEIYEPYLNLDCRFEVANTMRLFESLPREEQALYNFDVTRLNWRYYIQNVHIPGVKKFILKIEGAGTLEIIDPKESEPLEKLTIPHLLERSALRFPDRTALQIKRNDAWEKITYAELLKISSETAHRFRSYGWVKGDRLVLFSENQPEWGIAYLGAVSAGLVVVPIDAQTWHREVWSIARFTEAKAILASKACLSRLQRGGMAENEEAGSPVLLLDVDRHCLPFELEGFPRSTGAPPVEGWEREEVAVQPQDAASIIFTSGTFYDPRGAVHTHSNFILNLLGVNHYLPIYEDDQLLSVLPLYHALAFTCSFLMPIYGGATISFVNSLKPRVFLESMRETGTTCLLGVPTLLAMIRDDIERRILKTAQSKMKSNWVATSKQLSRTVKRRFGKNIGKALFARIHQEFGDRIRVVVSGGSALGGELYDDYSVLGFQIYEGYGLTETAPVLTVSPLNRSRRESAGKALPGVELRLYNPDENGIGEIIVQSPSLMRGYFKNPDATEKVILDQWFHTGDLGWVDSDGYVYITGRIKNVIVTGAGKNVYPEDLEEIYKQTPGISDICVVGIKQELTEEVHALIVPDPHLCGDQDEAAIKKAIQKETNQLARELPSYHRLQAIHISSQPLPRDEGGQLRRDWIRARLAEKVAGTMARQAGPPLAKPSSDFEVLVDELSRLTNVPSEEISRETDLFTDLGMDSLMAIELLLFLDHHFGLAVPDERASNIQTVGAVADELERVRRSAPSAEAPKLVRSALPLDQRSLVDRCLFGLTISSLDRFYRHYLGFELEAPVALPIDRPFIIAANHSSHLDFGVILAALTQAQGRAQAKRLHIVGARDYFFNTSLKSWFYSSFLNVFPIDREETSLAGLRLMRSILSTGEPILIFPEGTRSRTGRIQEFKAGLGLIAYELDVPILPAYIQGTFESLPAGRSLPRRSPVRVHFGEMIRMDAYRENGDQRSNEIYRQIASDVRGAIIELSKRARAFE